eukprot:COSAG02_NODE_342_length_24167_cov_5.061118_10_plen_66_part_00
MLVSIDAWGKNSPNVGASITCSNVHDVLVSESKPSRFELWRSVDKNADGWQFEVCNRRAGNQLAG